MLVDRSVIETAADDDASKLDLVNPPLQTTIASLRQLTRPFPSTESGPPQTRVGPVELTVYTVRATLVSRSIQDGDIVLVVADLDDGQATMLAKLAASTGGSARHRALAERMDSARLSVTNLSQDPTGMAQITGVGYFGPIESGNGTPLGAPNGIQLCPVLGFRPVRCGHVRQGIKTLSDPDAPNVNIGPPVRASIAALRQLQRPMHPDRDGPPDTRLAPVESTVYKVLARLIQARISTAGDVTLVVADPRDSDATTRVKAPDPDCVQARGSRAGRLMEKAREAALQAGAPTLQWHAVTGTTEAPVALSDLVRIEAPGFWEAQHGQIGIPPNGLVLEPMLAFTPVELDADIDGVDALLDRLSMSAEHAFTRAEGIRLGYGAQQLFTEFLLTGLYADRHDGLVRLLHTFVDESVIADQLTELVRRTRRTGESGLSAQVDPLAAAPSVGFDATRLSANLERALRKAADFADYERLGRIPIRPQHLLAGLLATPDCGAAIWLSQLTGQSTESLQGIRSELVGENLPEAYLERGWTSWPAVVAGLEAIIARHAAARQPVQQTLVDAYRLATDVAMPTMYRERGWESWPAVVANLEREVAELRAGGPIDLQDELRIARALSSLILTWHRDVGLKTMPERYGPELTARVHELLSLDLSDLESLRNIANAQMAAELENFYSIEVPFALHKRFMGLAPVQLPLTLGQVANSVLSSLSRAGSVLRVRGNEAFLHYQASGDVADLGHAIDDLRDAQRAATLEWVDGLTLNLNLGTALIQRFRLGGDGTDIDSALDALRKALGGPAEEAALAGNVAQMGLAYQVKFEAFADQADLEQAIAYYQRSLGMAREALESIDAQTRVSMMWALARLYVARAAGDPLENNDRAIELLNAALERATRDTEPLLWPIIMASLGVAFARRWRITRSQEDHGRALEASQAALDELGRRAPSATWAISMATQAELAYSDQSAHTETQRFLQAVVTQAIAIDALVDRRQALVSVIDSAIRIEGLDVAAVLQPLVVDRDERVRQAVQSALAAVNSRRLSEHVTQIETFTWYLRLETTAGAELVVGTPVEVTLMITPDEPAGSTPLRVPENALELTMYIEAPGFQLDGAHHRSLTVVDGRPRERSLTARLRPLASGAQSMRILVYSGGRVEGITPAELTMQFHVAPPVALPDVRELIDPRAIPSPDPDVIVYVTLEEAPEGQRLGVYMTCAQLGLNRSAFESLDLTAEDAAGLREAAGQVSIGASSAAPADVVAGLHAFGSAMFDHVMPRGHELRQAYRDISRLAATSRSRLAWLIVSDRFAVLPWEMVCAYFTRPDGEVVYDDFMAEKFLLTQWVGREGLTLSSDLPIGRIDLAHYGQRPQDVERWQDVLGGSETVGCEQQAGHLALMRPGSHYYGLHVLRFTGRERSSAITRARDGKANSQTFLHDQRLDLTLRRPFVGVSSIDPTQNPAALRDRGASGDLEAGWVLPVLHAGATAIAGPRWPVSAEADLRFFHHLHNELRYGTVLGVAVAIAREQVQLALPDRSDWLAYTCFGHPWSEPYVVRQAEGFLLFEPLDHPENAPYLAGETYQFRATYRLEAPTSYQGRLREPVASLRGKNISLLVLPMVAGTVPQTFALDALPPGEDYQSIVRLSLPSIEGSLPLLVRFLEDEREIRTFVLNLQLVGGGPR